MPTHGDEGSFATFDDAAVARDLLNRETGRAYHVERGANRDEFVVIRGDDIDATEQTAESSRETGAPARTPRILHRAVRCDILLIAPMLLMGFVWVEPREALEWIERMIGLEGSPRWMDSRTLLSLVEVVAGIAFAVLLGIVLYRYYAARYRLDRMSLTVSLGLVAIKSIEIRYQDIRSIGIKRTLIDRLLRTGTLEFAAAGTGDVDARFRNIADPLGTKILIQNLMAEKLPS